MVWRRWLSVGCAIGFAFILIVYVHGIYPVFDIAPKTDPVGRALAWDVLGEAVSHARATVEASPGATLRVAGNSYQDASMLAFHEAQPVVAESR